MEKKSAAVVLFVVPLLLSLGVISAADMPEEILLRSEGYETHIRGPVNFSHQIHAEDYGIECNECHHEFQDGENVWKEGEPVKKCAACHNPSESQGNVKKLRIAFHKNCKGCHQNLAREGASKEAPYRKCTDCHQRTS
jgi:hypothetical protein